MKAYGKFVIGLIFVWFFFSLSASAMHLFRNDANRIGTAVAIAASAPIVVFVAWAAASESFRRFVFSVNPTVLTSLQVGRFVGFTFVLLEARSLLPAVFAWPAGYGDMFIGVTAGFVAWKLANPAHRSLFILWQLLGIADLIAAVSLGTTATFINPQGPTMVPMTVLPLSLIPTFFVPLFLIFHIICIAQARAWKSAPEGTHPTIVSAQHLAL